MILQVGLGVETVEQVAVDCGKRKALPSLWAGQSYYF